MHVAEMSTTLFCTVGAARSESGRSSVTPHGPPQQPNDPISTVRSAGDGQQDEHSALAGPASNPKAKNRRTTERPIIGAENLVLTEPIPRGTGEAYSSSQVVPGASEFRNRSPSQRLCCRYRLDVCFLPQGQKWPSLASML